MCGDGRNRCGHAERLCSKDGLFDRAEIHISAVQNASDGRPGRFLIRDTWNTDVIEELRSQPQDVVLTSVGLAVCQTELDDILGKLGIRNLIFTGRTTSVCVDSTIFRDKLLLRDHPLIPRCCDNTWPPENLVKLDHREAGDLAQSHRESRFA
jgi:nicotinamidase-related amidase